MAINFGYRAASLVAAACYLFALVHAAAGRWATRPATTEVTLPEEPEIEVREPVTS